MKKLFLFLPMLIMACTTPQKPSQAVYAAQSSYAGALRAEIAYSNLPRCFGSNVPKLCSEVTIIKKLQKADDLAWSAIKEAQVAVRTPGYADSRVTTVVATAIALTRAFVEITDQLGVK